MLLNQIENNHILADRLERVIKSGRVGHAYIFEGDVRIDKVLFARLFVKAVFCGEHPGTGCNSCPSCRKVDHLNHEDIIYIEPDERSLKVEKIQQLQDRLRKKPMYGDRNIAIIDKADYMTREAQNKLLKTLEEPPGDAIIILLTENRSSLLDTILSRCVSYTVNPFGIKRDPEVTREARELAEDLMSRRPYYIIKPKIEKQCRDKERAMAFLDELELFYGELAKVSGGAGRVYKKEDLYRFVEYIEEAKADIKASRNLRYSLKRTILKIGG